VHRTPLTLGVDWCPTPPNRPEGMPVIGTLPPAGPGRHRPGV